MIRFLFCFSLFCTTHLYAQFSIEGTVLDATTRQPLAFVNIGVKGSAQGTSTDIDGKFKLIATQPASTLLFTYVGYEPYSIDVSGNTQSLVIHLKKRSVDLSEVKILPGENPAHRIIRRASKNREKNNPENIPMYLCRTYSKTYYDLVLNDDMVKNRHDSTIMDSMRYKLRFVTGNTHLLMMESVTERKYRRKDNLNETILATKVSGFKKPTFSTTATDLQPFSFYDTYFKILGKDYLNPISAGSTSKYSFTLEDTLYQGRDSVYIISFHPLPGKNFDGLKGVLYINTNGYAIQNVIASPYDAGLMDIQIRQQYAFIDGQHWFPEQLIYELHYKRYPSPYMGMKLTGKSYIDSVRFDTLLRRRDFSYATVGMERDAALKTTPFWEHERRDTLDIRERNTYRIIDSLGEKEHFDRYLNVMEALATLQVPVSFLNIDLNKLMLINNYEQYRFGVGVHTNSRVSKWVEVGGYAGYGIKDKTWKYGGDAKVYFKRSSKDYFFRYQYSNDLAEPGTPQYFYPQYNFIRNTLTSRMDRVEKHQAEFNFRALKFLTTNISANQQTRTPKYGYLFSPADASAATAPFKSTEVCLKGRYAFRERLVQSLGQLLPDGTDYPVLYFAYTRGFKTAGYGNYDYDKFSAAIEKTFLVKNLGKTKLLLEGGYMNGNVPYPFLFNGNGSYTKGGYLYIDRTFQTMGLYEFLSDRYVDLFFSHNFGSLLFKGKKFQPQFVIYSAAGYGTLSNRLRQQVIAFKTMDKGFYESGLVVNNIVKYNYLNIIYIGIGAGVFGRYGPYAYGNTQDNFAYKLSLTASF